MVEKPTIAMVGEAGKEAVVPLENNTGWIDVLVGKLKDKDGDKQPTPVIVKIGEDTILEYMVDKYEEKQFETNGEVFVV